MSTAFVQPDIEESRPLQDAASSGSGGPSGSMQTQNAGTNSSAGVGSFVTDTFRQSAHPVALLFLFLFRSMAIATYLLCGFFTSGYVFSTVMVVLLLSADFWTVRNVSGRVLVGLRFWNEVDDSGSSFWVFESRDPSVPVNAVDQRMFWLALYAYPAAWIALLFVGLLKFNISFIPIVILALVFNVTNAIGFTYADRDAKKRWATGMAAQSMLGGIGGGLTSTVIGGLGRAAVGKVFG